MKTFRTTAILLTGILCCISCTEHKPAQQKAQPTIRQDTPGPEKTQIKDTVLSVKEDSVLSVKEESAEAETLYLADLDKARQQRKLNLSQLFRKAKVILLDSCSKALVGNINRTAMTGGYLFVLDKDVAKTVFMFDRNGKFIRTIGSPGKVKENTSRLPTLPLTRTDIISMYWTDCSSESCNTIIQPAGI